MQGPSRPGFAVFCLLLSFLFVTDFFCFSAAYSMEYIFPEPYKRSTLLSGFTHPRQTINVSSEVAGKCLAIYADIGEAVPAPGIFAEIDATYIRLDIEANRLEQARVERQLVTEKKTLQRYITLRQKNSTTEATLDEVQLSADLHELTIKNLNNQYQRLQETLTRHNITVPKGWLLVERMLEPGEYVRPGQTLATLGDFRQLIIPFALSFDELNALERLQDITLFLPDLDIQRKAKIYRVSPAFTETSKKIPVDLIIESSRKDAAQAIRGGLRAEMRLQLEAKSSSYVLPLSAVINRYDAYWVMDEQQRRIKVIYLGTTDDGASAIVSSPELGSREKLLKSIPADF